MTYFHPTVPTPRASAKSESVKHAIETALIGGRGGEELSVGVETEIGQQRRITPPQEKYTLRWTPDPPFGGGEGCPGLSDAPLDTGASLLE